MARTRRWRRRYCRCLRATPAQRQQRRSARTAGLQARTEAEKEGSEGADHLRQRMARQQQRKGRRCRCRQNSVPRKPGRGASTRQKCQSRAGCLAERGRTAGCAQRLLMRAARALRRHRARSRSLQRRAAAAGAGRARARIVPPPREQAVKTPGAGGCSPLWLCVPSVSSKKARPAKRRRGAGSVFAPGSTDTRPAQGSGSSPCCRPRPGTPDTRGVRAGGRRRRQRSEGPRCRRRLRAGVARNRGAHAVQMHLLLRVAVVQRPHGAQERLRFPRVRLFFVPPSRTIFRSGTAEFKPRITRTFKTPVVLLFLEHIAA